MFLFVSGAGFGDGAASDAGAGLPVGSEHFLSACSGVVFFYLKFFTS